MLVFGGSLGARSINEAAIEAFARRAVPRPARRRAARLRRACARASPAPATTCAPYIDDFGEALAGGDLCVARAGGSIFEIAAHGQPAILVPYPARDAPTTRRPTRAGWPTPARRSSCPTPS